VAALERYDYDEAARRLTSYLALRPNDSEGLLLAAQTARRRGYFDEAALKLRQARQHGAAKLSLDAEQRMLEVQRGDAAGAADLLALCADDPAGAESAMMLEAIIEGSMRGLDPDAQTRAERAVELWLAHRISKFDHAQGLVWRGRVTIAFGKDYPSPQIDFEDALKLVPDHFQGQLYLATILVGQEPHKAVPYLDRLREQRPDDLAVRFQLARFHRLTGQPEEAARLLDEIITRAPRDKAPALVERSRVAIDLGRPHEAEKLLLEAKSVAGERREILLGLADCLRRQSGREAEVNEYMRKVKDIDEKFAQAAEQFKKLKAAKEAAKPK
jgi:tetratricopeptide (TPR) repeat protein